jgi:acylphosphatase
MSKPVAYRVAISGRVQGVGFRDATRRRALQLGLLGWVRNDDDGTVLVHAEGPETAVLELVAFLHDGPRGAGVTEMSSTPVKFEGHEQFAIRGVAAGVFTVWGEGPYVLGLEVAGAMRAWRVPKTPSMDPADKRMALELDAPPPEGESVWDHGPYEQGGRVPWPEALARGHAVFVLHGEKLRGGFALQRTRPGPPAQWLLVKRRDADAQSRA